MADHLDERTTFRTEGAKGAGAINAAGAAAMLALLAQAGPGAPNAASVAAVIALPMFCAGMASAAYAFFVMVDASVEFERKSGEGPTLRKWHRRLCFASLLLFSAGSVAIFVGYALPILCPAQP